jgi:hypothetical protein
MKKHARKPDRGHISRRAFVGGAALGAGVVAAGGSAALVGAAVPPDSTTTESRTKGNNSRTYTISISPT